MQKQAERSRAGRRTRVRKVIPAAIMATSLLLLPAGSAFAVSGNSYTEVDLVSDLSSKAPIVDTNLANPWGLARSAHGPWWIAENGTGRASVYTGAGAQVAPTVSIPSPSGQANAGTPTGTVYNSHSSEDENNGFVISHGGKSGSSTFMFATEDGTILGWNKKVDAANAIIKVDRSKAKDAQGDVGAVYKGLAIAHKEDKPSIYATNFRFGTVEMFNSDFKLVKSFTDPELTKTCVKPGQCYAPFGIQNIKGDLYVTFALQKPDKHDDQAGIGNGFVDVFSASGHLKRRLISHTSLNSPWGIALAPDDFGAASGHLLVGNFGDGGINIYDLHTGNFVAPLEDKNGRSIKSDGLWSIAFGNDGQAGKRNELFFTAGISDEAHGLFGKVIVNQ